MSNTKPKKSYKDFKPLGSDGVMPIAGYLGPHSEREIEGFKSINYLEDKYFQMVEDAGFNLISYNGDEYCSKTKDYHKMLSLAEKHNIKIFVMDGKINADMTNEMFEERIKEYSGYDSFAGIYICDEPSSENFPQKFSNGIDQNLEKRLMYNFAPLSRLVNSYDNLVGYTNLLPKYHWMEATYEDYDEYIREYCETYDPKFISYDHYPFSVLYEGETPDAIKYFYENFSIVYKNAKKYNLPIWAFIQAGGFFGAFKKDVTCDYFPSAAEMLWSVNISLAYGCKGLQYFTLVTHLPIAIRADGSYDNNRSGIIGTDGIPNRYYGYAKTANEQVGIVDEVLLKCESEGLISTGGAKKYTAELPEFFKTDSYKELKSVEAGDKGVVIGCFDYEGKTALYVVNDDMTALQKVKLNFNGEVSYKTSSLDVNFSGKGASCEFTLTAGGAVLVVLN